MYARVQKTYHGKTANQYLKDASIEEMRAGNFEIVSPLWDGVLYYNQELQTLVLMDAEHGAVMQLELSPRALERIKDLDAERNQHYSDCYYSQ